MWQNKFLKNIPKIALYNQLENEENLEFALLC